MNIIRIVGLDTHCWRQMIRALIEEVSQFIVMYIKKSRFKNEYDSLIMVCEHATETVVINAGVLFVFSPGVPDSYPVAIYVSDWIVSKRKRSGSSGASTELWDQAQKSSVLLNGFSLPKTRSDWVRVCRVLATAGTAGNEISVTQSLSIKLSKNWVTRREVTTTTRVPVWCHFIWGFVQSSPCSRISEWRQWQS